MADNKAPTETVPATVQDAARDAIAYLESERERLLRDNDRLITTVAGLEETVRTQAETNAEQARTIVELTRRLAEPPATAPTPGLDRLIETLQSAPARPPRRSWWRRLIGKD